MSSTQSSNYPSRFNLPQELINMVIDHLVSQQWHPRTREHLFHSIQPRPNDTVPRLVERTERLLRMIEAKPLLARCVNYLAVIDLYPSWFEGDTKNFAKLLADLLARLTNVSQLCLDGGEEEDTPAYWGSIPEQLRDTLYTFAARPSLRYPRLDDIDGIDLRLFIEGTNIEELEIRGCGPASPPPPNPDAPTSLADIRAGIPPPVCPPEDVQRFTPHQREQKRPPTRLQTRHLIVGAVPWGDAMDQAFTKVLENSAAFIEEYTLEQDCFTNLSDYRNAPIHPLPLAFHRFPNLMLLRINTLGNEFSRRRAQNPIPAVTMALDRLSQSNDESKLEEFEILFDFSTEGENHWRLDRVWDSLFTRMEKTQDRGMLTLRIELIAGTLAGKYESTPRTRPDPPFVVWSRHLAL
ncbi:hypothetical protein FA13DRAFT_1774611 [Coprinellus micaceus]|uniref:F-box domain-containing protein n=1 Tax=Coprinellus micaceus TaxID=71717 RepID=A0A4Y7TA87_COPMI|nr:hypothetical protein FA13DRAFT_1774611 [Coprinellus micaceus]